MSETTSITTRSIQMLTAPSASRQSAVGRLSSRVVAAMASATRPTTKLFTDLRTPLFFAVVWLAAVLVVDGTTFHLAPAIVAGAGAISMASRPIVGASLGLTMALLVTALLSIGGKLTGPTLLPVGGAALESVAAALLGTAVGLLAAVRIEHSHR